MKIRTMVTGYVLLLALFLFAQQHHSQAARPGGFGAVIDLTHTINNQVPKFDPAAPVITQRFSTRLRRQVLCTLHFLATLRLVSMLPPTLPPACRQSTSTTNTS